MTRYARSKGSKASNEREPEEATPWNEMVQSVKKVSSFNPEDEDGETYENSEDGSADEEGLAMEVDEAPEDSTVAPSNTAPSEENESELLGKKKKKKRNQNKCLNCKEKGHLKKECPQLSEERRKELQELYVMKVERKGMGTGRKKNKRADKENPLSEPVSSNTKPNNKSKNESSNKANKNKKPKMDITGKPVGEGEGLFQGFRVKTEDVPRLKQLEKDLRLAVKEKKIMNKELEETLKKERRRAENELARSKKLVCYLCRKPGHFLSDCPEAEGSKSAKTVGTMGSCFKCGSAEHSSKDCQSKLKGEAAYRFAVCFICNQTGHLAKACPDNPKGLYPKGGGCRFCGSVEHLKSECKRKMEKVEKNDVKICTLKGSSRGIEEDYDENVVQGAPLKKQAKVVKF